MEWINIKDTMPPPYQEVIIASNENRVKSAIYMGNGKWNTFVQIVAWMPYPDPPKSFTKETTTEAPKKKRGRPKKV